MRPRLVLSMLFNNEIAALFNVSTQCHEHAKGRFYVRYDLFLNGILSRGCYVIIAKPYHDDLVGTFTCYSTVDLRDTLSAFGTITFI